MLDMELRFEDGQVQVACYALPLEIGRGPDSHLRLKAWRVGKRHARIERRQAGLFLEDFGSLGGTLVNGRRVAEYGPLQQGDEILIGPCLIRLTMNKQCVAATESATRVNGAGMGISAVQPLLQDGIPTTHQPTVVQGGSVDHDSNSAGKEGVLSVLLFHRRRLHAALLEALNLRRRDIASMTDDALRSEASAALGDIISADTELPPYIDRSALLLEVVNEAVGLGPLEPLLADQAVTEIMVNRHDEIFVEINGKLTRHSAVFSSEQAVLGVIDRIVSPLGRRIDESSPMVDARLRDGSRVNAVLAPVALRGSSLTIRKFPQKRPDMDDLLRLEAFDEAMQIFLAESVRSKKNIIVSGGTGSGKTTLLNVLSNCIPSGERIVTIEDAAELKLEHSHLVALESRPANLEGRGAIAIRDLVRNALRMRPDRIVVGECRGGEAFDMLAAMNTGHEGSLTTLHANSPRDALARLETMILMAGMDLPLAVVREHIAASIHFIVQQARLSNGRRLITSIVEITGMESGRIQTQELFRYVQSPIPAFVGCGVIPECFMDEMGAAALQTALFDRRTELIRNQLDAG
ncbi:ATPase, T2SS/T4P/T4SS family [Pollutimonas harenae]|uniref:Flp pilus assembly complex ATPase component TadA n=1 Tax=Pollutimonas harenae TaxID=657015 RepID=A0A853H3S7_9BURK|nr:ATPase, T2SS/T4P/T4SS family [Pollutimonas harenae]NYT85855.1 Flp pilus assembly complex ATPase component TadA [Pollutimonas harenae]TEA70912.1 FHA domain-containing protein [Pollutimonas harenae]